MDLYDVVTIVVDGDKLGRINRFDYETARNVVVITNEIPLNERQAKYIKSASPGAIFWEKRLQRSTGPPVPPVWPYTYDCKGLWIIQHCDDLSKQPLKMRAAATGCGSSITRVVKTLRELTAPKTDYPPLKAVRSPPPRPSSLQTLIPNATTWVDKGINYIFSHTDDRRKVFQAWAIATYESDTSDLERLFKKHFHAITEKYPLEITDEMERPKHDDPISVKVAKINRNIKRIFPKWNVRVTENDDLKSFCT